MTETTRVHCYTDPTPGAWDTFLAAMHSGQVFECDDEMFYYWLEVLPPIFMHRKMTVDGQEVHADFGFAEGAERVTVFWRTGHGDSRRCFGCRTAIMNPHA